MGFVFLDPHPPPCGMSTKLPICYRKSTESVATKPYSANWRERRQKARVIAQAYKRRKPLPVWEESPF